jgi:hypothetical protein
MGFGLGGLERVKSVKANRAQLNNRKGARYFESPLDSEKKFGDFIDHTQMSPKEFEEFKTALIRKERKRTRFLFITFATTAIVIITLLIFYLKDAIF